MGSVIGDGERGRGKLYHYYLTRLRCARPETVRAFRCAKTCSACTACFCAAKSPHSFRTSAAKSREIVVVELASTTLPIAYHAPHRLYHAPPLSLDRKSVV